MKSDFKMISIRDLVDGYSNKDEDGVVGYGGKLDIRPPYQREFVYDDKRQKSVINSICKDLSLCELTWTCVGDRFEVLDGQQRILSICLFVSGKNGLMYNGRYCTFDNFTKAEREAFLDFKLHVQFCSGTSSELMEWFKIINMQGMVLTNQEILNASYTGYWLSDAKKHFSKTGCAAYLLANKYVTGTPIRQELLEKALKWISNDNIEEYMANHQLYENSIELWEYFQAVIEWVKTTFIVYRSEVMLGINYGDIYNKFKDVDVDPIKLEARIKELMQDDDVTNKRGIYSYVFTGKESELSIRQFKDDFLRRTVYENQDGICLHCNESFELEEMQADHIDPWSKGGKTTAENCQMLCAPCNRRKSNK